MAAAAAVPGASALRSEEVVDYGYIESLLADAEAFCGERPDKAVVGVPACFLPEQKAATEEACRALGLARAQAAYEPELAAAVAGGAEVSRVVLMPRRASERRSCLDARRRDARASTRVARR